MRDRDSQSTPSTPLAPTPPTPPDADSPPPAPPNAFDCTFLFHLERQDHHPTEESADQSALDATLGGPWRVLPAELVGLGVVQRGWGAFAEGVPEPYVAFNDRRLALFAAAVLPSLAHTDDLQLVDRKDGLPFTICRRGPGGERGGPAVGRLPIWQPELTRAVGWVERLAHRPDTLAHLLEAMPSETLARAGRIFRERVERAAEAAEG